VALLVAFLSTVATAQTEVTSLQLARSASVIVEGNITAKRSAWDADHHKIYTTVSLQVTQVHKGTAAAGPMQIRFLGGTVDDITLAIVEQPGFALGERVFLYLLPNYGVRDFPTVGQALGKFSVEVDPATGREVLVGEMGRFERDTVVREVQIEESR
jgi:hypothetical protein